MTSPVRHWLSRRGLLQVGSLGLFGLTLPRLLELEAREPRRDRKVKSCIFLNLYGGPSQIDIWDMKPEAPVEYRGEFRPVATAVPGTLLCEHLPRMARLARHYTLLRTLHHDKRNHQPAGCYLFTGVDPGSDNAGQLRPAPDNPPALGALACRMAPTFAGSVPPFIMLPARLHDQGSPFWGQTGGWLGSSADPLLIQQDVSSPRFRVDGFEPIQTVSPDRLGRRGSLLAQLDRGSLRGAPATRAMTGFQQKAFDLIAGQRGQSAFDLDSEPPRLRDAYGRNRFGQGCLLARRLIEAGARMVTVSDCTSSGHHEWDTHNGNFKKLRDTLLPRLDAAFSTLLEDLRQRGLLEETVVFLGGEFGRTPKVGQRGFSGAGASRDGRDHYPNCFTGILTGGHVRPGMVHGASDSRAAYPSRDPVTMEDFTATLFAAMGLDPSGVVTTRDGRPVAVTHGKPVEAILR